ncbi:MAG: LacI family DNA-binding transcriptional regulator [Acidobacteriaceae bacterium]|nr:LacI family DNA-binding transcriptional regulator [Acidobacteriaceae bacterium]
MADIRHIAERAGVSIATVSNVISGKRPVSETLAKRVREAIHELGYRPNYVARSLKVKQTNMLGMIIPDITNPFFPELMRGAEEASRERKYLLVTANTDERAELEYHIIEALRSHRVDGLLIAVAPRGGAIAHLHNVAGSGMPVVFLDRAPRHRKVDSVTVDNLKGAQDCVRHLTRSGHRQIAIITGSLELEIGRQRLGGYQAALKEAGIRIEPSLILEGDFREESGYRLGKEIFVRQNRPTAIFVSNGVMTLGLLRALDEIGVECPHDVAIATFDDLPFARAFHPHLTCVAQPAYELGYKGANLLIDRIQGQLPPRPIRIELRSELRIRESTMSGHAQGPSGRDGVSLR